MEEKIVTGKRVYYFDYLRVLAMLCVMILHCSCRYWDAVDVNTHSFMAMNIYQGLVRWGVPVFMMISGALFLNREVPVSKLYSKYIRRMITAFAVWTVFYAFVSKEGEGSLAMRLLKGHYHMWYIYIIILLYVCTPLLKKFVSNEKWLKIFLIAVFIISFALREIIFLIGDFGNRALVENTVLWKFVNSPAVVILKIAGYIGYYVLGYYLYNITIKKPVRIAVYALGILGGIATFGLDQIMTIRNQVAWVTYYNITTVNVLLESVAVFILFKNIDFKENRFISKMAQYTFGAYLVHAIFIEVLDRCFHINGFLINAMVGNFIVGCIVFVLSYAVSLALNNVPVVKKYIV